MSTKMVNCGACGKFMAPTGGAACSACTQKFHKGCLNMPEKATVGRDWLCPGCKKMERRRDDTPVKGLCEAEAAAPAGEHVTSARSKDAAGAAARPVGAPEAGAGNRRAHLDRELVDFMAEMREFRREMAEHREAQSARLDSVERRLDALEKRESDADVERRLDALEKREPDASIERRLDALEHRASTAGAGGAAELERTVAELRRELNERDQEALLADLEIGQLPEERGVSVLQSVCVLAARLGVPLDERDVVFAERVGAPPAEAAGRPRRVVVRLARRQVRDELLRAARVRRTLTADSGARVFLNERLTRHNRQLFHRAREECRSRNWRYVWTKRGRVYVRRADGQPAFHIRTDGDLDRALVVQNK